MGFGLGWVGDFEWVRVRVQVLLQLSLARTTPQLAAKEGKL